MPNLSYIFHKYLINWFTGESGCMVQFWKKNEKVASVLKCLLLSYIVTGLLILFLAFLLYKFSLPKQAIGVGVIIVYILSAFLGGLLLGKSMRVKKYLWGLALGTGYFLILVTVSLIVNGGFQNVSGNFFLTMILCGGSGMLGGMLS